MTAKITPGYTWAADGAVTNANLDLLVSNATISGIEMADLAMSFLRPTTAIYVDAGRVDSYTADGSIIRPFKTIQEAIDASEDNDTIFISPGSFTEDLTIDKAVVLFSYGSVTITGSMTITKPAQLYNIASIVGKITIENDSTTVPVGIINCYCLNRADDYSIYMAAGVSNSALLLRDTTCYNISATKACLHSSRGIVLINNCVFLNLGGGNSIYCVNDGNSDGTWILQYANQIKNISVNGNLNCGAAYTWINGIIGYNITVTGTNVHWSKVAA